MLAGTVLFYKGFEIIRNMEKEEAQIMHSVANIYDLLEGSGDEEETVVKHLGKGDILFPGNKNFKNIELMGVMVGKWNCVIGVMLHLMSPHFGDFDPFYIQRIKHTLLV